MHSMAGIPEKKLILSRGGRAANSPRDPSLSRSGPGEPWGGDRGYDGWVDAVASA